MNFTIVLLLAILPAILAFQASTNVHAPKSTSAIQMMATQVARNENFAKLQAGYLFPEIARRRNAYLAENPDAQIISLGIGDTTQPIPEHILGGLVGSASKLGTKEGYSGYGAEQGMGPLREKISQNLYNGLIKPEEVFVSDGAKCDIARLQIMFGSKVKSAVQDPSYPVYVDTSVIMGQTGAIDSETSQFSNLVYMPCNPSNDFFPDLSSLERADVIYFCSPNNPTGAVATKAQLEELVRYAKDQGSILVFDAAYAPFIRTPGVPKSIYEVEGAREVAIEVNSFSKYAGFTGVRLGWTVVPDELKYADGTPVRNDFNRVMTTGFNGASNIVQGGGLAALDPEGLKEIDALMDYYLENAKILKQLVEDVGGKAYGGEDSPYVFWDLEGKSSWEFFSRVLEEAQVVTIPGAGFGPGGEGFLRLSAFAPRESCIEAARRIKAMFD
mmetsp:Transcript_33318/g.52406  ORF Transcript_33318/g.52406 Transcript_33318/m.52406 type:complete len:443 (-) Transcript_33318:415-1743(-)